MAKLLGHSDMLGNPIGLVHSVGDGVAGFVRGVGRGLATGDGEELLRGITLSLTLTLTLTLTLLTLALTLTRRSCAAARS